MEHQVQFLTQLTEIVNIEEQNGTETETSNKLTNLQLDLQFSQQNETSEVNNHSTNPDGNQYKSESNYHTEIKASKEEQSIEYFRAI